MKPCHFRRVIWAVDIFAEDNLISPQRMTIPLQNLLTLPADVEATYVMTPKGIRISLEEFPEWLDFYKNAAINALNQSLTHFQEPKWNTSAKVLVKGSSSLKLAVQALLDHAEKIQADLITACTHARQGIDRIFLGSFAECLLRYSRVPLFLTQPQTEIEKKFERILFATDLGPGASTTLESLLPLARELGTPITLVHAVTPPFSLLPPPGMVTATELKHVQEEKQARAWEILDPVKARGTPCDIQILTEIDSLGMAISHAAQKAPRSLLVMESYPESKGATKTYRQILHYSPRPLLVFPVFEEAKEITDPIPAAVGS